MNELIIFLMIFFALVAITAAFLELRCGNNKKRRRGAHFVYGVQAVTGILGIVITVIGQNRYSSSADISVERGGWMLDIFNGYLAFAVIFAAAVVLTGILAAASGSRFLKMRIAASLGGQLLLILSAYLYSALSAGDNSAVTLSIRAAGITLSQIIALRGLTETVLSPAKVGRAAKTE